MSWFRPSVSDTGLDSKQAGNLASEERSNGITGELDMKDLKRSWERQNEQSHRDELARERKMKGLEKQVRDVAAKCRNAVETLEEDVQKDSRRLDRKTDDLMEENRQCKRKIEELIEDNTVIKRRMRRLEEMVGQAKNLEGSGDTLWVDNANSWGGNKTVVLVGDGIGKCLGEFSIKGNGYEVDVINISEEGLNVEELGEGDSLRVMLKKIEQTRRIDFILFWMGGNDVYGGRSARDTALKIGTLIDGFSNKAIVAEILPRLKFDLDTRYADTVASRLNIGVRNECSKRNIPYLLIVYPVLKLVDNQMMVQKSPLWDENGVHLSDRGKNKLKEKIEIRLLELFDEMYGRGMHGRDMHGRDMHGRDMHGRDMHGRDMRY